MLPYTHGTNLYDKMLTSCSSSSNYPVISCDNIEINLSNVFLKKFLRIKFSKRKPKKYYPHQSVDSKNSADLCLQVDTSADRPSPPVTNIILVCPPSASLDHRHLIRKYHMI